MQRSKQQLSNEVCLEILKNEKRGVLSLIDDDGYPYAVPMNHWYCCEDGNLYFHGANKGHKIDLIKMHDQACFTIFDQGYKSDNHWSLNIKSVVIKGRIELVCDMKKAAMICKELCLKFSDDKDYVTNELKENLEKVQCLQLIPESISGKIVNES